MRREEIVEESDSTDNQSINGRYHRFNVKLGRGAFKEVYKAFDTQEQIDVAWNSIDLSLINTEDEKKKIFKECEMLRRLNHVNILKITNQWYNSKTDKLCFITNIVQDGSLSKFFRKRQVNLLRVKTICKQILKALFYLHTMGVIHRDLKCDNIFIEGNTGKVVLGDLGLSCNVVSARSIVGTPHWMAPELYREDYNEMVDIWSFGMCVLELITSLIPYSECKGAFQVYQHITTGKKPESLKKINDPYVRAFIGICLNVHPSQRPSAKELLDHPFLYKRPPDATLCSQLMIPREYQTEPPLTAEEKIEEDRLNYKTQKQKHKKRPHHFHREVETSPAPPQSNQYLQQNDVITQRRSSKKTKKEKVDVKSAKTDGDTIRIKLQIVCAKFPKPMNVEFDFSHKQEEASSVALEMTRDLELPSKFTIKVEKAIKHAINRVKDKETPVLETKSRKSLGPTFNMTALDKSPKMESLGVLPTSSTSLTPNLSDDSPPAVSYNAANNNHNNTKDPMFTTGMTQRKFGFGHTGGNNNAEGHTDFLTSSPPGSNGNNMIASGVTMPMIRGRSSPDPVLNSNGCDDKSGSNMMNRGRDNSLSNDQSSIGSIPQPTSGRVPIGSQSVPQPTSGRESFHVSQSVPYPQQQYMMNNNAYIGMNGHYVCPPSNKAHSVPNKVPSPHTSPHMKGMNGMNMQRSSSQPAAMAAAAAFAQREHEALNRTDLPPIPDVQYSMSAHSKYTVTQKGQYDSGKKRNISPPKSTTPPTPPPVIGIQDHNHNNNHNHNHNHNHTQDVSHAHPQRVKNGYHPRSQSNTVLANVINGNTFTYNSNNVVPRSRSTSPGPPLMNKYNHNNNNHGIVDGDIDVKRAKNVKFTAENKENKVLLSDGLLALQKLNNKSSDTEIFRATLKLTLEELIAEFVSRSKTYNKSEGKNGLARKLVNVLKEEIKNMPVKDDKSDSASPITAKQLELPKKEQSPDSVFSAKSVSVESMLSIKRDSGSVLKLKDFDSGTSSHNDREYDLYNNYTNNHAHSATTIIHSSYPVLSHMDKNVNKTSISAHTLAPSGAYNHYNHHNGHNGHISNVSSMSNMSSMSTMTMNTASTGHMTMGSSGALSMGKSDVQDVPSISSLGLRFPFFIEELSLPSPSTGIIFDDDVLAQISIKQFELHNEYIDFVKRKYELLQLRYTTLEAEYKDNEANAAKQLEMKTQEVEHNIRDKITNKGCELTDKFVEWLSDREQIALLKQRIEKKRSTSVDKLPAFDVQLEFENDPQFIQLMQSRLSDIDKRECKHAIESFRKEMMENYKTFYFETIQKYKHKEKQITR